MLDEKKLSHKFVDGQEDQNFKPVYFPSHHINHNQLICLQRYQRWLMGNKHAAAKVAITAEYITSSFLWSSADCLKCLKWKNLEMEIISIESTFWF